jgi:NitT/TauT family transport system substrate-binding protein
MPESNHRETDMETIQTRRHFLAAAGSAGAASLIGAHPSPAQQGALETTRIRLAKSSVICVAPIYVADELLRLEGFTDIEYLVRQPAVLATAIGRGEVDFALNFSAPSIVAIDAGEPLTVLAGVHVGCFELFANERIRSIRDLKGKKVGVQALAPLSQLAQKILQYQWAAPQGLHYRAGARA